MIGMTSTRRQWRGAYKKKPKAGMNQIKLAIAGRFGRGKDTVAEIIEAHLVKLSGLKVERIAFADALKYEVAEMAYRYEGHFHEDNFERWYAYTRERRDLFGLSWQWWGEYMRQTAGEDYWVKHPHLQAQYRKLLIERCPILLTDMRLHNENAWLRDEGFFCVRVDGPNRREGEARDPNHVSEVHIHELQVDYVVSNTSTLDMLKYNIEHSLVPRIKERFAVSND